MYIRKANYFTTDITSPKLNNYILTSMTLYLKVKTAHSIVSTARFEVLTATNTMLLGM
jgi:hypothetical protein